MMLLYNHNTIIKTTPFMKPVEPQEIVPSKSICARGMCSTVDSCFCVINYIFIAIVIEC